MCREFHQDQQGGSDGIVTDNRVLPARTLCGSYHILPQREADRFHTTQLLGVENLESS